LRPRESVLLCCYSYYFDYSIRVVVVVVVVVKTTTTCFLVVVETAQMISYYAHTTRALSIVYILFLNPPNLSRCLLYITHNTPIILN
jgi:hypothetical protein